MNDEFIPFLMECGIPINSAWFQQDGVRPPISDVVVCLLRDSFRRKQQPCEVSFLRSLIKHFHGYETSLNLQPCDYFLWGYLNEKSTTNLRTESWHPITD
jgi:hypothetical protein